METIRFESSCHQPVRTTCRRCAYCSTKKNQFGEFGTVQGAKRTYVGIKKDTNYFKNFHPKK